MKKVLFLFHRVILFTEFFVSFFKDEVFIGSELLYVVSKTFL